MASLRISSMASLRRLLFPLRTAIALRRPLPASYSLTGREAELGWWDWSRGFSGRPDPEKHVLQQLIDSGTRSNDAEIEAIRREFEEAKRSFLSIPAAVRNMTKMNPEGIYVNKSLRLDTIQVYGFDYDYTLAHYSSDLQSLIYDLAKQHLVDELKYPEVCLQFKYDPAFPIRGLYYDKQKGCLLKLDFFGSIEPDGCYFGRRKGLPLKNLKTIPRYLY